MASDLDINGSSVLIADDNPDNLDLLQAMLEEFECEVLRADDGERAVIGAREHLPDVILLDIHMPKQDGYATCEILKADETTRDIPVIFISAMNEEFNKVRGFESGAVDYLTKPVKLRELKARLGAHLELAQQRRFLVEQAKDLQVLNRSMMGRGRRIAELEQEVNALSRKLGRDVPYPHADHKGVKT